MQATCEAGVCGEAPLSVGTACEGVKFCDTAGVCVACKTAADCADPTMNSCVAGVCQAMSCTDTVKNSLETDIDCGGPTCPRCRLERSCTTFDDCASGVCTTGLCMPCGADDDCQAGNYCTAFTCTMKELQGTACSADNECASEFCPDGFCCDQACDGACESCTSTSTSAPDGTCAAIDAGTDPDDECAALTCTTGTCNGSGACGIATGATCFAQSCSNGVEYFTDTCSSTGSCVEGGGSVSCGAYQCSGTNCRTSCGTSSDCMSTHFCSGSACVPTLGNGSACTSVTMCTSGVCTDGFCCDQLCDGTCQACNNTGSVGTCSYIPLYTDDANPSCTYELTGNSDPYDDVTCNGSGACLLALGEICLFSSECASGKCVLGGGTTASCQP